MVPLNFHLDSDGLVQCTQVESVEELLISVSLEDVTMWKELGEQLKISETQLNRIQNDSVGSKEKTSNVLRYNVTTYQALVLEARLPLGVCMN